MFKPPTLGAAGLESHPDHAIAQAQMDGFGGVISFEVDGESPRLAMHGRGRHHE